MSGEEGGSYYILLILFLLCLLLLLTTTIIFWFLVQTFRPQRPAASPGRSRTSSDGQTQTSAPHPPHPRRGLQVDREVRLSDSYLDILSQPRPRVQMGLGSGAGPGRPRKLLTNPRSGDSKCNSIWRENILNSPPPGVICVGAWEAAVVLTTRTLSTP